MVVTCNSVPLTLFIPCSSVGAQAAVVHTDELGGVCRSLYLHGCRNTYLTVDWRQFTAFWPPFFLTSELDDGVIQRKEGWERAGECRERAGREEEEGLFWSLWTVITTYSCFLPGALTGHQQSEGGRKQGGQGTGKRGRLSRAARTAPIVFLISKNFHLSPHK